jgi:hypothetical protein
MWLPLLLFSLRCPPRGGGDPAGHIRLRAGEEVKHLG